MSRNAGFVARIRIGPLPASHRTQRDRWPQLLPPPREGAHTVLVKNQQVGISRPQQLKIDEIMRTLIGGISNCMQLLGNLELQIDELHRFEFTEPEACTEPLEFGIYAYLLMCPGPVSGSETSTSRPAQAVPRKASDTR